MTVNWKSVLIGVSIFVAVVASDVLAYYWGHNKGILEGIKAYHQQCFEVGGYIISDTGQVVVCGGQGTIPKEELKNFKDNS